MKQVQCNRFTKKHAQCLNKSIPGSEYCLLHQPREVWPTLIVGVLLGFILGCLANYIFYKKSLKDDLVNRYISQQRYVPPAINGFPVIIADGTNINVARQPGSLSSFVSWSPFKFRVDNEGIIEIYGEIRSPDNTLVVTVHKEEINITPGTGIDINGDSKGYEIVDSDGSPVFQLSIIPYEEWKEQQKKRTQNLQNEIDEIILSSYGNIEPEHRIFIEKQILEIKERMQKDMERKQTERDNLFLGAKEVVVFYYVHYEGNSWWCVTPSGSVRVLNHESMLKWQRKIPQLFKYPGHKYPGVRVEIRN